MNLTIREVRIKRCLKLEINTLGSKNTSRLTFSHRMNMIRRAFDSLQPAKCFDLLFYSPIFSAGKKKDENQRLNSKTIRFDQKKWKDNLVLHYLISKWIFFLITFRRHQDLQILISPKSLILQTKKFLENDARIQKWLKRLGFCRNV